MSTYKEINGQKIQNVSSDPSPSFAGQVWYNTTSGTLKVNAGPVTGSWATGGSLNVGPDRIYIGGCGTKTAALAIGAGAGVSGGNQAMNESYDGTSWTEVGDMNSGRNGGSAAGVQTSALYAGGIPSWQTTAETWNGSNWTSISPMNTAKRDIGSAGDQTAALAFGGNPVQATTESGNGS